MDSGTKLTMMAFVLLVLSTLLTLIMKVFDTMVFLWAMLALMSYGGAYVILLLLDKDSTKLKKDLRYAIDLANLELDRMEETTKIIWNRGISTSYARRLYKMPQGEYNTIVALRGHTGDTAHGVIALVNLDKECLEDYNPEADPEEIKDPWKNFDKFYREKKFDGFGSRFFDRRRNRLSLMGEYGDYPEPDTDMVNRAMQNRDGEEIGDRGEQE